MLASMSTGDRREWPHAPPWLRRRPSLTAEAVCFARALEHLKPEAERVVDDPFAQHFLSPAGRRALGAWSAGRTTRTFFGLGRASTSYVPLRHRFIDDRLLDALEVGAEQVVLLGAGYDSRAYRFAERLAGRPVYEVDLPAISRFKAHVIAEHSDIFPKTHTVRVEIDFETETLQQSLPRAGFRVGAPTFFTWEGVSMYLTRAAVQATLDAVWALSGSGSAIAFDMWHLVDDPSLLGTARRTAPAALSFIGEPIIFGIHPEEIDYFLDRRGFAVSDLAGASELRQRYAPNHPALVDDAMYVLAAERLERSRWHPASRQSFEP